MAAYPVARTFFIRDNNDPSYHVIMSVFAAAETQKQHDMITNRLNIQKLVIAAQLAADRDLSPQKLLDDWCASIQKDFGVECHGLLSEYIDGLSFSTEHNFFKEAMDNG